MAEKLTDARVRSAHGRDTRYSIMDAKQPGLELRVHPDGRRVFALRCSVEGKDVRVTIGQYGLVAPFVSLEQARLAAAELRIRFQRDPRWREQERLASERQREQTNVMARELTYTVNDLADAWIEHSSRRLRASTMALHAHRIDKHIRPALGSRALTDVSRADVRQLINSLQDRAVTANNIAQLLSALFRFARAELERDVSNPAADFKPFREQQRTRVLSDNELRAFWQALDDPTLPPGPQISLALKIALYSCQRMGEIIGARDDELDFENSIWVVPACRTKSGRTNRVPLTPRLATFFRRAQSLRAKDSSRGQSAPVFPKPGDSSMPILRHSASKAMARLCKTHLKWETSATPHDLRRTSRTLLVRPRLGVAYEDAERVMSHVTGSTVSRRYVVDDFLHQKRRALESLAAELDRIIGAPSFEKSPRSLHLQASNGCPA